MQVKGRAITEGDAIVQIVLDVEGGPVGAKLSQTTPVVVTVNGEQSRGTLLLSSGSGRGPHSSDPRQAKRLPRVKKPI